MPCYLLTYHGHGTWLPDHPRGYVRRKEGMLATDSHMAACYRANQKRDAVRFDDEAQTVIAKSILATQPFLGILVHAIACEDSHVHVLLSWNHQRAVMSVSKSIKTRITRELNEQFDERPWLSKGGSLKRVVERSHFDHLVDTYLPRHRGLFWREGEEDTLGDA